MAVEKGADASVPVLPADAARESERGADRLAPADAARRHDPPGGGRHLLPGCRWASGCCKKIEQIVREEQDRAGAHRGADADHPAGRSVARESGRYDDYGKEMLRIKDRHEREMLYGPTNEEMITDIFRARRARATGTCRAISITSSGSSATRCARASASCAAASS